MSELTAHSATQEVYRLLQQVEAMMDVALSHGTAEGVPVEATAAIREARTNVANAKLDITAADVIISNFDR